MSEQPPIVTICADELADGRALTDDQLEFARQIFVAVMRRGLRRLTADMDVTADQYAEAEQSIQEWADIALSEEARWTLN